MGRVFTTLQSLLDGCLEAVRRFGAREIAPEEQEVESNYLRGHSPYLMGQLKGEKSMVRKQLNVKGWSMKCCESCVYGET